MRTNELSAKGVNNLISFKHTDCHHTGQTCLKHKYAELSN